MRPAPVISLTSFDKALEIIAVAGIAFSWIFLLMVMPSLPEKIPTHFDLQGKPDGFQVKYNELFLPLFSTIIWVALTILNRFPQIFNYPVQVTKENAASLYRKGTFFIRLIKCLVALVFAIIIYATYWYSKHSNSPISQGLLPVLLVVINIPILLMVIPAFRNKKV
ncbi:MAG: DUF1648 domain-containing protein [Ferruginibacter sp.]